LPLKQDNKVFGVLNIFSVLSNAFNAEETKLLTSLADNLSYGITMLRTLKARELAEERLRRSEARYKYLFQNHHAVMLIIDPENGAIVDANPSAVAYYGWDQVELCQMKISQINLLTEPEIKSEMEMAKKQKRNYFLFRHRRSDGSIRDVEVFSGPVSFSEKPLLFSIINDITGRMQIEKALRDSERRFRSITDQIVEMVYVTDDKGRLTYVSSVIEKMFGYKPHEAMGRFFTEYLVEEEIPRALVIFHDTLLDRLTDQIHEFRFRKRNGSLFYGEVHIRYFRDQDSFGMIGLIRDTTERRQYELEMLESKQFLKDIYDKVNHSIFVVDVLPEGIYRFRGINPQHEKLTGISSDEIAGKTPEQLLPPVFAEQVIHHYDDCIFEGKSITYEEYLPFKGEETLWETVLNPVSDDSGTVYRIIGTSTNITERRHHEEERAKLERQLQQSQKMEMVGRLAGGIAHDFNNMLSVILGHSEMALELIDPSQTLYTDLEAIHQAATRSADLTRQLLAFARKQIVIPKILELNTAVEEMLPMFRRLIGENIKLVWIPDGKNPILNIDPTQIDQILVNLVVNARDAITGNGRITLESGIHSVSGIKSKAGSSGKSCDYATLSVSDDGCGIEQNDIAHIFEPFFTTKEQGKGTGLGLAMVYGIIKQNNGTIECQSEPEKGTIFTIHLPLYRDPLKMETIPPSEQESYKGHHTILLVEDEPSILNLCKLMLERNGYNVLEAGTSAEAIRIAETYTGIIDLLLTDVIMPDMNGSELSKKLLVTHPALKTLFMSGFTADVISHNTLLDINVNFIHKPFNVKSLTRAIYKIFNSV
jgi:two-component system cell cycle sensor histidine kinase/response regulator CckA